MLSIKTLFDIAKCRIEDAKVLASNHRPDGAIYLCGYTLEMVLKRRIAMILDWGGYPETRAEFKDYLSFKVHDLDILLRLSGLEKLTLKKFNTAASPFVAIRKDFLKSRKVIALGISFTDLTILQFGNPIDFDAESDRILDQFQNSEADMAFEYVPNIGFEEVDIKKQNWFIF